MIILISLITVQISSSGRNNSGIQGYSSLPSTNTPGTVCVCVWEAKLQARTEASVREKEREEKQKAVISVNSVKKTLILALHPDETGCLFL